MGETKKINYKRALELLMENISPVESENVILQNSYERILACDILANENVPAFEKSPYDGYAFIAADTLNASCDSPVKFKVIDRVGAGKVSKQIVKSNTTVKVMTGTKIPVGADAVIKYEDVIEKDDYIYINSSHVCGENIIKIGEDIKKDEKLAEKGTVICPSLAGSLAMQDVFSISCYKKVKVGIVSTGNEIRDNNQSLEEGTIRNSNRYIFDALLKREGAESKYYGVAKDDVSEICSILESAICECDAVILTGGVSVGDYDFTKVAFEKCGINILFDGASIKPGMACCYGISDGKLIAGLSGNPASAITNYYMFFRPALKKLMGYKNFCNEIINMKVLKVPHRMQHMTRIVRGIADLSTGQVILKPSEKQGNIVLSKSIGFNAFAIIDSDEARENEDNIFPGFII